MTTILCASLLMLILGFSLFRSAHICPHSDPLCRPDRICMGCLRSAIVAAQLGIKPPRVIFAGRRKQRTEPIQMKREVG